MMGAGVDIRLVLDKLWDEMPSLEGWGDSENPQAVALRPIVHTGTHVKPGAPEVTEDDRETPVQ